MKPNFIAVGLLMAFSQIFAQHTYQTDAVFDPAQKKISVHQKMVFYNHSTKGLDRIYVNDWNHAYSDSGSPLSNQLSDDYNFRFEKSLPSEKGNTSILNFYNHLKILSWKRLENQPDIVEILLPEVIEPNSSISISTNYTLNLPSDHFTGYGITNKKELILDNWQLLFAYLHKDGSWTLDSNLGYDDISLNPSHQHLAIRFPEEMKLAISVSGELSSNEGFSNWLSKNKYVKKIPFVLNNDSKFDTLQIRKYQFITDLADKQKHLQDAKESVEQLIHFINSYFPLDETKTWLLQSDQYDNHPIVGIDLLYNTLKPLPPDQILTLKMAKTLIFSMVRENSLVTYRNQPWLVDGLAQYLFMRYIDTHQADLKLVGNFDKIPGFRNYGFSKAKFNDRYFLLAGFAARQNVSQPLNTPNNQLSKYNRKIANPSKAGLGLKILQKSEGTKVVDDCIQSYFFQNSSKILEHISFKNIVLNKTKGRASWYFDEYLSEYTLNDYAVRTSQVDSKETLYKIINRTSSTTPIPIALLKGDSLVHTMWLSGGLYSQNLRIENQFADKIVINPDQDIVEVNLNNNNIKSKGSKSLRNIKFSLFEDIPNSHYSQWFMVPDVSFNAYDGLQAGLMLNNGLAMKHPFFFSISPLFSSKTNTLNGKIQLYQKKFFQNQSLSQTTYGASFESYHYAPNLRYFRFSPVLNWYFRPYGISDNRRSSIGLRYVSLKRESAKDQSNLPDFNLFELNYVKSNFSSALTQSLFSQIQASDEFSKLNFSYTYRKFYKQAKQIYVRFFGGVFLSNKQKDFYNFGVSRVNDYAFSYNLFGRSEQTGFYSQQFVMAEGGFKSFLKTEKADHWMFVTNLNSTIWRALELYADFGVIKNRGFTEEFIYDSGLGINLIQNYFQLYFPFYSNLGWEVNASNYSSKIRFTLTADPEELFGLFSRTWF
jgi:hypothetical protein